MLSMSPLMEIELHTFLLFTWILISNFWRIKLSVLFSAAGFVMIQIYFDTFAVISYSWQNVRLSMFVLHLVDGLYCSHPSLSLISSVKLYCWKSVYSSVNPHKCCRYDVSERKPEIKRWWTESHITVGWTWLVSSAVGGSESRTLTLHISLNAFVL